MSNVTLVMTYLNKERIMQLSNIGAKKVLGKWTKKKQNRKRTCIVLWKRSE